MAEKGPTAQRNVATVSTFLRLLEEKDVAAWIELWAEDADHYYPYGTEMFPAHLVGKAAIHARWKDTPGLFDSLSFPIRETWVDGDTVLTRFDSTLVLKDGAGEYRNSYLGIFKFDDAGLIREYWEYFDPILAGTAFGLLEVIYKQSARAEDDEERFDERHGSPLHPARAGALDAALAHAERFGVSVSIVDDGGHVEAFARLDGSTPFNATPATNEATAAGLGMSTLDLIEFAAGIPPLLTGRSVQPIDVVGGQDGEDQPIGTGPAAPIPIGA